MQDSISRILHSFEMSHIRRNRMLSVLLVLALLMGSGVFWMLRLTGVSMSGEAYCGLEEHEHSEECIERKLVCGFPEGEEHIHDESCYVAERTLICVEQEHTHAEGCYATEGLLCCYKEYEHLHDENCYDEAGNLVCPLEELPHVHSQECYIESEELICRLSEHTHNDNCYIDEPVLSCGVEEASAAKNRRAYSHG